MKNISPKYLSKISLLISVLLIIIVVASCAPQQPLTDEELEAELAKLTPEEREELLADLESKESGALAGQAIAKKAYVQKVSPGVARVITRASPVQVTQIKKAIARTDVDVGAVQVLGTCGDTKPDPFEACDDGDKVSGDGCSSTCQVESGWTCTEAYVKDQSLGLYKPSVCTRADLMIVEATAITVVDDESKVGSNDLWVWLEVPENLPSGIGDTFNVEVYIKPGSTRNIGDLKLTLAPSDGKVLRFTGKGTKNPYVGDSLHGVVIVSGVGDQKPGSITIFWDKLNLGLVQKGAPLHLASLQMRVKGSGSFQIEVIKTSPASLVRYFDGTGGWSCPAPIAGPSKIACVEEEDGFISSSDSSCSGELASCSCAASTCSPVYPQQIGSEGKSLVAYTLKQANTRVIRNSHCVPNPNACSGKCGKVDDGCGDIVNCGSTCS